MGKPNNLKKQMQTLKLAAQDSEKNFLELPEDISADDLVLAVSKMNGYIDSYNLLFKMDAAVNPKIVLPHEKPSIIQP